MSEQAVDEQASPESPPESGATKVASGIFSSKVTGLVRESTFSYFFGVGAHADVLQTAFRLPNLLQNLLGEGTISAAFIPIYSRMLKAGRQHEAGRFAGAIFGLLLATAAVLSLLGVLFAESIVTIFAPGFVDDPAKVASGELSINRFSLTVRAVRIIFPMAGILTLSAWALGVLNSHRRFFLPYVAPVLWNIAIIGGMFGMAYWLLDDPFGIQARSDLANTTLDRLLFAACFGALAGGLLQFLVQVPLVFKLTEGLHFSLSTKVEGVRESIRAFGPVVAGRGVYQLSAYLDQILGSLIAAGALSSLRYAQTLYLLPISLFGLSVAAAELPELSRIKEKELKPFLRRIDRSMRQMMFMTIPTFIGYLGFGFLVVGLLFRQGKFGLNDNWLAYLVLGGYTLGLVATAASRLLQNSFYALNDTKTPAKIAVLRVAISAVVAVPLMFWLDQFQVADVFGFAPAGEQDLYLGAVGLAVGASVGAWIELLALRYQLAKKLGSFSLPWSHILPMVALAVVALVPGLLIWRYLPDWPVKLLALVVIPAFGLVYLGGAFLLGFSEVHAWLGRLTSRFKE